MSCWIFNFIKFIANPIFFSHSVHSMLGLQLIWRCFNNVSKFCEYDVGFQLVLLRKVYRKSKIFFSHSVYLILNLRLAWCCHNDIWVKFCESYVEYLTCLTFQSILEISSFLCKQIITQFSFFSTKIANYSRSLQDPIP